MTLFYFVGIALAVFVFALVIAFALGKRKSGKVLAVMGGIAAAISALLGWGLSQATSWDAIGVAVLLCFFMAPIGLGGVIGGLFGWFRSGR